MILTVYTSLPSRTALVCLALVCLALAWAPAANAQLVVRKDTTISENLRAEGGIIIEEGATLTFDPHRSVTVESVGNVVVRGTLRIAPASASIRDTLRIVGADPQIMKGGHTHHPLETDRGLWVMGGGRLDIRGTPKTPWAPRPMRVSGWAASDDIRIAPHTPGESSEFARVPDGFDWKTSSPLTGSRRDGMRSVLGDATAEFAERGASAGSDDVPAWPVADLASVDPLLDGIYPEILNLTRNVVIEGEEDGYSHIFIHLMKPAVQVVKYAEIRFMGPRAHTGKYYLRGTEPVTKGVLSRYPMHFHMSGDNSRGSQVEGVVIRKSGQRGFVPHGSHGITYWGTIAYDVVESPYWWDPISREMPNSASHDIVFDHAVAAKVDCHRGNSGSCYSSTAGFTLQDGARNVIRNSVAVGVQGSTNASGFHWPSSSDSEWEFHDNIAHNNKNTGIFVWQNHGPPDHFIRKYTAYMNDVGITHGAYGNDYHYEDIALVDNNTGVRLHASSDKEQAWTRVHIRGGKIGIHGQQRVKPPRVPVMFRDGSIVGAEMHVVLWDDQGVIGEDKVMHAPTRWHFVDWTLDTDRIDVSQGTEVYETSDGKLVTRDYTGSQPVYRLLADLDQIYTGSIEGPYYRDYSTSNTAPYLIEMVSTVMIEKPDGIIEFRGRSNTPVKLAL